MDDIVARLTRARKRRGVATRLINIRDVDTNEVTFSFTVKGIDDKIIERATNESTVYVDTEGNKLPEGRVEQVGYRCRVIFEATIDEDKQRVWSNPRVLDDYGTLDPIDVINDALLPGEKIGVFSVIADLSGFSFRNFAEAVDAAKKP